MHYITLQCVYLSTTEDTCLHSVWTKSWKTLMSPLSQPQRRRTVNIIAESRRKKQSHGDALVRSREVECWERRRWLLTGLNENKAGAGRRSSGSQQLALNLATSYLTRVEAEQPEDSRKCFVSLHDSLFTTGPPSSFTPELPLSTWTRRSRRLDE